jgi:hypothetical protein
MKAEQFKITAKAAAGVGYPNEYHFLSDETTSRLHDEHWETEK